MTTDDAAAYDIRDAAIDLHDKLCGEMLIHGQCDSLADNECGVEQAIAQAIRDAVAAERERIFKALDANMAVDHVISNASLKRLKTQLAPRIAAGERGEGRDG